MTGGKGGMDHGKEEFPCGACCMGYKKEVGLIGTWLGCLGNDLSKYFSCGNFLPLPH